MKALSREKILTVFLSIIFSLSSFAGVSDYYKKQSKLSIRLPKQSELSGGGAIAGGGGDATIINGEEVIRDIIDFPEPEYIENSVEFLDSVKDFRQLILDISKVMPELAGRVVNDLASVNYHLSYEPLAVLPYSQTTVSGPAANIQLFIRTGDEILVGPTLLRNKKAQYEMLHEAFHPLLENNAGPIHHMRVRNIIKYIYKNRKSLSKEGLSKALKKSRYKFLSKDDAQENAFVFDNNTSNDIRCYWGRNQQSLTRYLGLNCLPTKSYREQSDSKDEFKFINPNALKFLQNEFGHTNISRLNKYDYRNALKENTKINEFKLLVFSYDEVQEMYKKDMKKNPKYAWSLKLRCDKELYKTDYNYSNKARLTINLNNIVEQLEMINDSKRTLAEKIYLMNYFQHPTYESEYYIPEVVISEINKSIAFIDEMISNIHTLREKCPTN